MARLRFNIEVNFEDCSECNQVHKNINIVMLDGAVESHQIVGVINEVANMVEAHYMTRCNLMLVSEAFVARMPDSIIADATSRMRAKERKDNEANVRRFREL